MSGLINLETTLRVERFPIAYYPVTFPFHGIRTTVSGVGFNVAKALTRLGDQVSLLSMVGRDAAADLVHASLQREGIAGERVLSQLDETPQSVILYDGQGRRQIHVDLKDIQQTSYPMADFEQAVEACSLVVLCNINFSRPFLSEAVGAGKTVATDVHTIADLDDPYNRDFMRQATILFMSDERLPCAPEDWANQVLDRFGPAILVIGLGAQGALLAVRDDGFCERLPAARPPAVVNTIGAGDALFSAFLHYYLLSGDPYQSLKKAIIFAAQKIGTAGAADGFLDQATVDRLLRDPLHQQDPSASNLPADIYQTHRS